jgi:hypothetical protein
MQHHKTSAFGLAVALGLGGGAGAPAGAQSLPVSPTGIPYTVPAAARAAGWTLAADQARTGFFGSNPAFLCGGSRIEVELDAAWQGRTEDRPELSLDEVEARLGAATGKVRFGNLALGVAYQRPYHAQYSASVLPGEADEELETVVAGAALELVAGVHVGASLATLRVGRPEGDGHSYQASLGVEIAQAGSMLAAAVKSTLFGADAARFDEPTWVQLDGRLGLGPVSALAARLGVGWWNGDAANALEVPIDVGIGARWQVVPLVHVLGGVHQVRHRISDQRVVPLDDPSAIRDALFEDLDQGTFLDLGVLVGAQTWHAALAVEDNRVFGPDIDSTWITLSMGAGF